MHFCKFFFAFDLPAIVYTDFGGKNRKGILDENLEEEHFLGVAKACCFWYHKC